MIVIGASIINFDSVHLNNIELIHVGITWHGKVHVLVHPHVRSMHTMFWWAHKWVCCYVLVDIKRCQFAHVYLWLNHITMGRDQNPTIFFEFVPIPKAYPSVATYAHPCPPIAWDVPTHVIQIAPMYSKIVQCVLPAYTKSWLDWTNKMSLTVAGFSRKCLLVSVFPASEKFDSDLELDTGMHKSERATRHAPHDGECGGSFQLPPQDNTKFSSGIMIHWQC